MDFKFSKDSEESQHLEAAGEKKSQRLLLVLLLILVGGFSYLYFFTALIKPLETQKATEPLATVQQSVKIPLPSREGGPGKIEGKTPEKAEPPKPAVTTAPVTIGTPAVNPAPPPASKPVPAPSKPKEEVIKDLDAGDCRKKYK